MTGISELLLSRIRDVQDYPEPGVVFKDITPLLADPAAFTALTDSLAEFTVRHGATKVVGLEARGFILGAPVAVRAGVGFIPVRKAGSCRCDAQPGVRPGVRHRGDRGARRGPQPGRPGHGHRRRPRDGRHRRGVAVADPPGGAQVAGVAVLMELGFLDGRARLEAALDGAPLEALIKV